MNINSFVKVDSSYFVRESEHVEVGNRRECPIFIEVIYERKNEGNL
jgi:hypothetical protein